MRGPTTTMGGPPKPYGRSVVLYFIFSCAQRVTKYSPFCAVLLLPLLPGLALAAPSPREGFSPSPASVHTRPSETCSYCSLVNSVAIGYSDLSWTGIVVAFGCITLQGVLASSSRFHTALNLGLWCNLLASIMILVFTLVEPFRILALIDSRLFFSSGGLFVLAPRSLPLGLGAIRGGRGGSWTLTWWMKR